VGFCLRLRHSLVVGTISEGPYSQELSPQRRCWEIDICHVRIAITLAAFETIAVTLPFGSVGFERKASAKGERLVWLEETVVQQIDAMRRPGESYSDVIPFSGPASPSLLFPC